VPTSIAINDYLSANYHGAIPAIWRPT